MLVPADITDEAQVDDAFTQVQGGLGGLNFLSHSITYNVRLSR